MYIPFDELNAESRVWIYQGNKTMSASEKSTIGQLLHSFCEQWAAHGQPLKTSFKIEFSQFVIMAVDEDFRNPSGCSIDSSVGVLRQIQSATGIDFLDRTLVPFYINNQVELIPLAEIKSAFASGRLKPDTITFNTLATTKGELELNWKIPAEKSWMAKYLPKTALTQ
jgi:hypothetical protein